MQTFNEYQEFVRGMKKYPEKYAIMYPAMKMNGEAGEIAEKVGKAMRGDNGDGFVVNKEDLLKECGDVLWYVASLADDLGYTLQQVVDANQEKLESRKDRGVLKGSGDNR